MRFRWSRKNDLSLIHIFNAGAAADHARRAGNNVLCHVEYRHSDVKGMRDDKHRNERFEKPLKEHERVDVR